MKKEDFKKAHNGMIEESKKQEYLCRLQTEYKKLGINKCLKAQFDKGSGKEIEKGKFWADISSSRLAFELYSWRAESDEFIDFEFEKRLPGIWYKNKREAGYPNMDVYFETIEEITFIESKFTETPPKTVKLAEAYWNQCDRYHTTSKQKGTNDYKTNTFPLECRYHNNKGVAEKLVPFYQKYLNKSLRKNEWFDFAQEMKHLFGIVFYVIENKEKILNRKISFYNIVYHFDEYESLGTESKSDLATSFVKEATQLVNEIFISEGLNNKFIYDLQFVQSELEKNGNQKAFGSNDSVRQLIKKNFNIETYP